MKDDLALTVAEVARATRVGRNTLYDAIARHELRVVRLGRRIVVPIAAVEEWLDSRSRDGEKAQGDAKPVKAAT